MGIVAVAVTSFLAVQVVWRIGSAMETTGWGSQVYPWVGLLALLFAVYGLALSAASTPFTALLVDVSDEQSRSRLVGIGWAMLIGRYRVRRDYYLHRAEASVAGCLPGPGAEFGKSTLHHCPGHCLCAGVASAPLALSANILACLDGLL